VKSFASEFRIYLWWGFADLAILTSKTSISNAAVAGPSLNAGLLPKTFCPSNV
jgi:hypothetical protein